MSKTETADLPADRAAAPLVVETSRGPSLAGTRITIYTIMDYLQEDFIHALIKEDFRLSDEQLRAALQYIADHREEVEREYREIVRRSARDRAQSELLSRARSPYPPDLPLAEKNARMREEFERKKQALQEFYAHHDPARP
jgi:uncharacterized protein (DUF433 family)